MKVGEYIIEETLGSGSFGETCKAKKGNDPICVLKRIQINQKSNKETKPDEKRDIKLEHENIVQVFEVFNIQGHIYIAMELCETGNINDYFMKMKPDVSERFTLMVDMAKAVNFLHSKNIIHCGLKPENILIKNNGDRSVCKVSDFLVSGIKSSREDLYTSYLNSPGYIPPEMQKGLELSSSTDVFTLGLVFFAVSRACILKDSTTKEGLVPGELNNEGKILYLNAVLKKHHQEENGFLESYFKKGESDLGKLLYSMLRPKPEYRPNMEKVLLKTVEAKMSYKHQIEVRKMKEENCMLQTKIQTQCRQLESVNDAKKEVMAENETLQREIETSRNEARQSPNSFKYFMIFMIFGTLVAVMMYRCPIKIGTGMQNSEENQMNDYSTKLKQVADDYNKLKDQLNIEKYKGKMKEDEIKELHDELKNALRTEVNTQRDNTIMIKQTENEKEKLYAEVTKKKNELQTCKHQVKKNEQQIKHLEDDKSKLKDQLKTENYKGKIKEEENMKLHAEVLKKKSELQIYKNQVKNFLGNRLLLLVVLFSLFWL